MLWMGPIASVMVIEMIHRQARESAVKFAAARPDRRAVSGVDKGRGTMSDEVDAAPLQTV